MARYANLEPLVEVFHDLEDDDGDEDDVRNVFWGVVTNPNGQCTVLGVPTGLKSAIW